MAIGEPRYGVDPYLEWVNREGVPVVEDIGIDLHHIPCSQSKSEAPPMHCTSLPLCVMQRHDAQRNYVASSHVPPRRRTRQC